jgi:hypothetical protein
MIEAKFETTVTITETSGQVDVMLMANTPLGSVDAAASAVVRLISFFLNYRPIHTL